ncbi:MAG: PBP1A family penicillin-binding protein [Elusimicrobiota bacterium]
MRQVFKDLPSIDKLAQYTPSLSTYVYDINGEVITEYSIERRSFLTLDKIPLDLQNALIAMEDKDFFKHWGISVKGMARAFVRDVFHRKVKQGGSTITQQLSKLIFLKPERTISRKIKEIFIALQIEKNFSKQEILQMYFNQIYFGNGVYGVQTASKIYFGKDVSELTLAESAMLVAIIPAPERYSPFANPQLCAKRRALVLKRMYEERYITKEEMEKANNEPLPEKKSVIYSSNAPYFTEYIRQQLEPKYGIEMFWKGGLKIYTSLDIKMQKVAEEIFEKKLSEYELKNIEKNENEKSTTTLQGAFIAMDSHTGAIKVMIGGRNYKESQFNRATQAKRQAGSTFKPFVWLSALSNGYTPATIVYDNPMAFYADSRMSWHLIEDATDQASIADAVEPFMENPDFKVWIPANFDGKFLGPITLRKALEKSRNLVSVYLVNKLSPNAIVDTAIRAGIKSKLESVPSIGLGTSLVSVMEMTAAFNTFANSGIYVEPLAILKVCDNNGKVLEENFPKESEVFRPQEIYLLVNMMKGVVQRGTGKVVSRLKRPIAGKTGTSQGSKDTWFIGFSPDITAGAWMGYDDYSKVPMSDWTGGSTVAPWWTDIMQEILKEYPVRDFVVPEKIVFVNIDEESGKIAGPKCKSKFMEAFLSGTEPTEFCDIHQ